MNSRTKNLALFYCCILLTAIIAFIVFLPDDQKNIYMKNYIVDGILGIASLMIFGYNAIKRQYKLFSPITVLSAIYITLFFFTPMYDIVLREYEWFGVDLFAYGMKGSLIAFLGYIAFIAVYNRPVKIRNKTLFHEPKRDMTSIILLMYVICLAANIYYLVRTSGHSLAYIFSLGLLGSGNTSNEIESNLGFISNLSFALPSCTLLYCEYGRSKPLKIILFVLMFILQVERGFRFYIIQIILMFISYIYTKKDKKIKLVNVAVLLIGTMIPIVLMTMFRNSIRAGSGMDLTMLTGEAIRQALDEAIWDNFRIYKTYYGIIKAVPDMTPYMFGQQMIVYTLIMFIPRIIWPGKPLPPGDEAVALGISPYAVLAGTAYPNIGEYYYEFGIVGVIFFMGLFSRWMKTIDQRYRAYRRSNMDLMVFCTLLGAILQIIIRGYTPSNFWMIVFTLLPYFGIQIANQTTIMYR